MHQSLDTMQSVAMMEGKQFVPNASRTEDPVGSQRNHLKPFQSTIFE
jgi:hypothetical protein